MCDLHVKVYKSIPIQNPGNLAMPCHPHELLESKHAPFFEVVENIPTPCSLAQNDKW